MRLWILFLSVLSFFLFNSPESEAQRSRKTKRKKPKVSLCEKKISMGVRGKVMLQRGNMMPSPDGKPKVGNGVKREIGFFELTKTDQTIEGKGPGFYKMLQTKLFFRTSSDVDGCFAAELPPGKYSMFVKEEGQWYANSLGGEGEIFEVEVKMNEITPVTFNINHSAFY
jgi:hypothetical protein